MTESIHTGGSLSYQCIKAILQAGTQSVKETGTDPYTRKQSADRTVQPFFIIFCMWDSGLCLKRLIGADRELSPLGIGV